MLSDVGGGGLACVLNVQFLLLFFVLKKIGFAPWPDIMLSQTLTRNYPFVTNVIQ